MTDKSLVDTLREIDLLKGLAEDELERIASVGEEVDFAEGATIFREGAMAENVYLITAGSVSLEICAPGVGCRRILTVGKGELLGWSPVLEHARLTATARALEPTSTVQLNGRQILTVCEHNPRFGYEFMRRAALALAKRLSATRLQLLDVYGGQMPVVAEGKKEPA